jgi:hypothetical protein
MWVDIIYFPLMLRVDPAILIMISKSSEYELVRLYGTIIEEPSKISISNKNELNDSEFEALIYLYYSNAFSIILI